MLVSDARKRPNAQPVYLVEITLLNGGPTLYLSDRNIFFGGQYYLNRLDDLSGIGEEVKRADSTGLNSDITLSFSNEPCPAPVANVHLIDIGDTYPFEGAACLIKEIYITGKGTDALHPATTTDYDLLASSILDEPANITLAGFQCKASSKLIALDENWKQDTITTDVFPNAFEDINKIIPFVYGDGFMVPAHRVDWGVKTTLKGKIGTNDATLELSDVSRCPATPFDLWIDYEKIHVTARAGFVCSGLTRAYGGTAPSTHRAGADVWFDQAYYDSVLASHACGVGDIYAEIQGRFLRVTSGVSSPVVNGRQYLRASSIISVDSVDDAIGVTAGSLAASTNTLAASTGSHSHSTSGGNEQQGTGGGHSPASGVTWTGNDSAMYDGDKAANSLVGQSTGWPAGNYFTVGFPAWAGGTIRNVKYCLTYKKYLVSSGTASFMGHLLNDSQNAVTVKFDGGTAWQGNLTVQISAAANMTFEVLEMWQEVTADTGTGPATGVAVTGTPGLTGAPSKSGTTIGTRTVDRFHAMITSGYTDPDGNYGGIGSTIQRPDWLIKHFLVQKDGFSLAEIDGPSFAAAGAAYAAASAGGYKFKFQVDYAIKPSDFAKKLAAECRSTLRWHSGKWYLYYLPDAAPTTNPDGSAIKTLTEDDLAGDGAMYTYDRTSRKNIKNDLRASFARNYSKIPQLQESDWNGTSVASDAVSIAKFGSRPTKPDEIQFEFIRDQAMADHVLAHMLLESGQTFLLVTFPVFWENFDVNEGDTVQINSTLFSGGKFFVEEKTRQNKKIAIVKGREWYGYYKDVDSVPNVDAVGDVDKIGG